jgi:hypothetical protein
LQEGHVVDVSGQQSVPRPQPLSQPPLFAPVVGYAATAWRGRSSTLAERLLGRVREEIGYYADLSHEPADLASSAHIVAELSVASLSDPARTHASAEYAWELGHRRGAEGVPLGSMLHAFRIGGEELWNGLCEVVARDAPEQAGAMATAATAVWRLVDRNTSLMTEAHRRATGAAPEESARRIARTLKALLRGHSDELDLARAAIGLGIPLDGRYAVVRLTGPGLRRAEEAPVREEVDGWVLHWCRQAEGWAVLAELGARSPKDLQSALWSGAGLRVGISPAVQGLAALGQARELAEIALGTCVTDGELARLDERLAAGLVLARPDLARELREHVLGPVLDLEPEDRDLLLATLAAWLDCGGDARQVGTQLYCHRNTVLNRLRRLERITGRRLDRPRDVVDLSLALDAYRLHLDA